MSTVMEKRCVKCNVVLIEGKNWSMWNKKRKLYSCDQCYSIYHANYYKKNKKKYKETELKRRYNITLKEFEEMWQNRDGKCAICERPLFIGRRGYAIIFLQSVIDNKIIQKAIQYLSDET